MSWPEDYDWPYITKVYTGVVSYWDEEDFLIGWLDDGLKYGWMTLK